MRIDKSLRTIGNVTIVLFAIIVIVGVLALTPGIFSTQEMIFQVIAVVLSVLCTAVVTTYLLIAQSKSEENQKKAIKIHENKIKAYSAFMRTLWSVLDDGVISCEEIKQTRSKLFEQVFFYLDDTSLAQIESIINDFKKTFEGAKPEDIDSSRFNQHYRNFATAIAACLKNNLKENGEESDSFMRLISGKKRVSPTPNMEEMWKSLEFISQKYPAEKELQQEKQADVPVLASTPPTYDKTQPDSISEVPSYEKKARRLKTQAWHFCELNTEQLDYISKGGNELSLIEYGEYKRTNLVKQVKPNDVVFLFRGNWKYAGAFVAKGWRVFEYDENRNVMEYTSDGIDKVVVKGDKVSIESVKDELAKYDIYKSYLDSNSTSCANVVVDKVSFIPEGVENPNTTYRKTISRYYWEYAVRLMDKFTEKETDQKNKDKIASLFE